MNIEPVPLGNLPSGRERLSAQPHWRMHSLPITYEKVAIFYLADLKLPVANTSTGELAAQVWLLPRDEPPLADCLIGNVSIGTVHLPGQTWHELREAEATNLYADGIVFCWPQPDGSVEPDALRCVLPS